MAELEYSGDILPGGEQRRRLATYGAQVVQMGTFSLSVNGTQVCADNASFAYNVYGGPMRGRGNRELVHQLQHRRLRDHLLVAAGSRRDHPGQLDQHRQPQRHQRQRAGRRFRRRGGDQRLLVGGVREIPRRRLGARLRPAATATTAIQSCRRLRRSMRHGYSQRISWFYGSKIPALIPGAAVVPFVSMGYWRWEGASTIDSAATRR